MSWIQKEPSKGQRRSAVLKSFFKQLVSGERESFHSGQAATLRLEIERLEEAGVGYQLTAFPGHAYVVKRLGSFEEYLEQERAKR